MALFRALETTRPAPARLFADPLALRFLHGRLRAAARLAALPVLGRLVPAAIDRRWPGPRPSAVVRTRAIDDALRAALARGLDQLVLLGAGYDSRPYRIEGARAVRVFEVDLPATQAAKRAALGPTPAHVRFVPLDFDRDPLGAAMERGGLVAGARTFIVWEGVVAYLEPAAVDATLRWAGRIAGPRSELVFTYVHRGVLDGGEAFPDAGPWVESVRAAGEPFVFGLDPAELADYLAERGWRLVADHSTTELLAAYGLPARRVPGFYRLARAEVLRPLLR
jgi:methyltransferase (TIGR00027 family)